MKTETKPHAIIQVTSPVILLIMLPLAFIALTSCNKNEHTYDGSGTFEATEIVVSSEATGSIMEFHAEEGKHLSKGEVVGYIDTTLLHLQKEQIEAQIKSIKKGIPDVKAQTRYFDQQIKLAQINLSHLEKEQNRIQDLVEGEAATQKDLDDIDSQAAQARQQIQVLQNQKGAQVSALSTQKSGMEAKPLPFRAQLKEINEKIERARIVNPRSGTVLTTYAVAGEFTAPGRPLYRIADLSKIYLKAYITGEKYADLRLNQKVTVITDDGKDAYHSETGTISWISDEAEFTPKTIRTKEERENLVYAIKVTIQNDGRYKIGMYGEVKF